MNKNKFSIVNEETGEELNPLENEEIKEVFRGAFNTFRAFKELGEQAQIALNEASKNTKNLAQGYKQTFGEIALIIEEKTGSKPNDIWEAINTTSKMLNIEKEELLKLTLVDYLEFLETLPRIVKDAIKNYPISGHFFDMKLRTKHVEGGSINTIIPRLIFSSFEDNVVNSLLKCLYLKSEKNSKNQNYYLGNGKIQIAKNGNGIPQLIIQPQELYKEIMGKSNPSGKDVKEIKEALEKLSTTKYEVEYRKRVDKEYRVVKSNEPLLNILKEARFNEVEFSKYEKGDKELFTKKHNLIISFNPVFSDQIREKFILMPTDLEDKITLASPKRVKASTNCLRDYLLRALSNKDYTQQIYKEKLEEVLNLSHMRKKRRDNLLEEALNVCKQANLLNNYSTTITSKGIKHIFELNPNYLK
jgi:hypothetical protein